MRTRLKTSAAVLIVVAGGAAMAEHNGHEAARDRSIGVIDPAKAMLVPSPIPAEWVVAGKPRTFAAEIAHTDDGMTRVFVWQTSAARFHWNYDVDEVIQVVDGEVFIADETHGERRLGPGDVAFFPKGARTLWRVPDHLRKIATIRREPPSPIADVMRWLRAAKQWGRPTPEAFAG